jgi:uracil-DNA glycosylase
MQDQKTIIIPDKLRGLKDKLVGSGWEHIMNPYIDSEDFYKTINRLIKFVQNGQRFTPKMKDWFRAFQECPYDKLKVIVIGQDPYPQVDVADGISFSCSKTKKLQPSLRFIFKALNGSQYDSLDPDLTRWANQGVLMLNTALTVEINKIGSHYSLWRPFTEHLLTNINKEKKDLVVVNLGAKAKEWAPYLSNQHIINVKHPASAAYKGGVWDHEDLFNRVNEYLSNQNKSIIAW